jgi:hypothetical protein
MDKTLQEVYMVFRYQSERGELANSAPLVLMYTLNEAFRGIRLSTLEKREYILFRSSCRLSFFTTRCNQKERGLSDARNQREKKQWEDYG